MPNTETTGILELLQIANVQFARAQLAEARALVATQRLEVLMTAVKAVLTVTPGRKGFDVEAVLALSTVVAAMETES